MADNVTLTIDGQTVTVAAGTTILEAAASIGIEIPVFCNHPKLEPIGACRQCLVEVEGQPKPIASCCTPAAEGMIVHTKTPSVRQMWEANIEFLLINHPLDCPICDRGGECPLQNNTFAYGPRDSRFDYTKRRYKKPVRLSDRILLDRERCIQCFRCVRFQKEIADEPDIQMFSRGYYDYIDTAPGKEFESQFSGNTIELCPVGALTSAVFRFKARPWEIQSTESVCVNCGVGCNIRIDARNYREVVRFLSRENPEVDDGWLCDKGRFDSLFINDKNRLQAPLIRKDGRLVETSWDEALETAVKIMKDAGGRSAGLISPKLTNEAAYLFSKLMREFGAAGCDWNLERASADAAVKTAEAFSEGLFDGAIKDITSSTLLIVYGSDISSELPVMDLWIKKAVRRNSAELVLIGCESSKLAKYAKTVMPENIESVVKAIESSKSSERVLIMVSQRLVELSPYGVEILDSLKEIARSRQPKVMMLACASNSIGMLETGAVWGKPGSEIKKSILDGNIKALWVAGESDKYAESLARVDALIVQDMFLTKTAEVANIVLPGSSFAETSGTIINTERRVQCINPAIRKLRGTLTDVEIFARAAVKTGLNTISQTSEDVFKELTQTANSFAEITLDKIGARGVRLEAKR